MELDKICTGKEYKFWRESLDKKRCNLMDEKVIIGKGTKYPLDGILSLPENLSKKVPAVVLIHGSGSSDKDETIMANNLFMIFQNI